MIDEFYKKIIERAKFEADVLISLLSDNQVIKDKLIFCKKILQKDDVISDDEIAAIKYIQYLANEFNIHNKYEKVMESNLSRSSYIPCRSRR